jgi:predicted metal-dependent hydrolase
MTELVVRRLLIDLEAPFRRHWNGGDPLRSAWLDALSMSFPVGEQFFIGQEATHRRIHQLYNQHLQRLGYTNTWENRSKERLLQMQGLDPRHAVAATAATEHFTAIFADWILRHPQLLEGAEPRLRTLWMWHASEESEHRCTAIDVYRAMGGNEEWRRRWMRRVSFYFLTDALRQTVRNLWHDGQLLRWRTLRSAASLFLGRHGLLRAGFKPWRAYFRADFHPSQQDASLSRQWLQDNRDQFTVVGRSA